MRSIILIMLSISVIVPFPILYNGDHNNHVSAFKPSASGPTSQPTIPSTSTQTPNYQQNTSTTSSSQTKVNAANKYVFVKKWGSEGTGDGQFSDPRGIAIDSYNNVYVADADNNGIQKFDSNGKFITKWGSTGTGDGQFNYPADIAIDSSGKIYVTDSGNTSVQLYVPYNNAFR
jgi:tripartite motif-containing protein 71